MNPWNLSVRELEVARMIARGMTRREIGSNLGVTEKTVKNTALAAYRRMNVRNAVECCLSVCREYGIPE